MIKHDERKIDFSKKTFKIRWGGAIFVSIDDSEQAYLKILMDEIFGEENFIGNIIWQSNTSAMKQVNFIKNNDLEYIMIYSKNKNLMNPFSKRKSSIKWQNIDNDKNGNWTDTNATYKKDENNINYFPIKLSNGKEIWRTWRFSKEDYENKKINLYFKDNNVPRIKTYEKDYNSVNKAQPALFLSFLKEKEFYNIQEKIKESKLDQDSVFINLWKLIYNHVQLTKTFSESQIELKDLGLDFSTTKPVDLIKKIINLIDNKTITVLDFFAGSGTTGHAVMELNRQDQGNRKFILVTNNENDIAIKTTYERLYRIINGKSSNNQENDFKWLKNNKPFVNNKLRVFNIKHYNVETSQIEKVDSITTEAINNLQKLSPSYKPNKLDIYYDLDGLNPYDDSQLEQEYSTDPLFRKEI